MTLNGAMALLRYFSEFTYNVVLKQLLGLHPFQNLLLIVYDHINYVRLTGWPVAWNWRRAVLSADAGLLVIVYDHIYDLRNYSAIIWVKRTLITQCDGRRCIDD